MPPSYWLSVRIFILHSYKPPRVEETTLLAARTAIMLVAAPAPLRYFAVLFMLICVFGADLILPFHTLFL